MKTLFTLLISLLISLNSFSQGSWTQLSNFPNGARYGATSLVVGDKVYVGQGLNFYVSWKGYKDWWGYDTSNGKWARKENFLYPYGSYFNTALTIQGKCYVGLSPGSKAWYQYDPEKDKWTQKKDFPGLPRYGTSTFVIDSFGFVCSGNEGDANGPFTKELWRYNPRTDTWKKKADLPAKVRYFGIGFSINGKGYVQGGVKKNQMNEYKYFDDLWEYDPVLDIWTEKASSPAGGTAGEACFVVNNKAYVGLGEWQQNYNKTFYVYDPVTDTWNDSIAEFTGDGREVSCSFSLNGVGYVMLGYNPNKQGYYNDVWQYTPLTSPRISLQPQINIKPFVQYTLIGNNLIPFFNPLENASSFYFKLYDLSGRLIQSQTINTTSIIYLDADLPKGIYLIETNDGIKNSTQKIFIK